MKNAFQHLSAKYHRLSVLFNQLLPEPELRCFIADLMHSDPQPMVSFWPSEHPIAVSKFGADGWVRKICTGANYWNLHKTVAGVTIELMQAQKRDGEAENSVFSFEPEAGITLAPEAVRDATEASDFAPEVEGDYEFKGILEDAEEPSVFPDWCAATVFQNQGINRLNARVVHGGANYQDFIGNFKGQWRARVVSPAKQIAA